MNIEITYPTITPIKLTGAALRSMQSADERGLKAWKTLEATMQALSDALESIKDSDYSAGSLLVAYHAITERDAAYKAVETQSPRWSDAPNQFRQWLTGGGWDTAGDIIHRCADYVSRRLVQAGVPIPTKPAATADLPQWLHDLQAMGVE